MVLADLAWLYLIGLVAGLGVMTMLFYVGARRKRFDIVDVGWGSSFIAIAWAGLLFSRPITWWKLVLVGMVTLWGARLSLHILQRFLRSQSEDKRYVELRSKWGIDRLRLKIFVRIFCFQVVLAVLVMTPVLIILASDAQPRSFLLILGTIVWVSGFITESIADKQLQTFLTNKDNLGTIMINGLWHYSRHPNYFGELTQWWGIGIIALGVPYGWAGLFGPLVISWLIIFVSGLPPLERSFVSKPGWDEYKRSTSVLVPWFKSKA